MIDVNLAIRFGTKMAQSTRIDASDEDTAAVIAERGGSDPLARDGFHQEVWQWVWGQMPGDPVLS